jgi:PEGA domain
MAAMNIRIPCFAALSFMACLSCAAAQAAPQAPSEQARQFTVLRTGHLVAGTESLTNAEANCSIAGAGGGATMQCRPSAAAKASYHFNTALVVESNGVAYVIACRIPLLQVLCKKLDTGSVVEGRIDTGILAMTDGDKVRRYQILVSANVGPLLLSQPPPSNSGAQVRSVPTPAATPAPPSKSPKNKKVEIRPAELPNDPSAACLSSTGACVTFVSEPQGADIYVDGKFMGNTPSMVVLAPGSHELRMDAEKFASWSRPFEASAGSKITIRATLQSQAPQN